MMRGKAKDGGGKVVEYITEAGEELLSVVVYMLMDIMKPAGKLPEFWRQSIIRVWGSTSGKWSG